MTNKTEQAKQELSAETLNLLKNNVVLIIQPAEEGPGGAKHLKIWL